MIKFVEETTFGIKPDGKRIPLPEAYLYRCWDQLYAAELDEWEKPIGRGRIAISMRRYRICRYTRCGVWIDLGGGKVKFVNLNASKRWALPTEVEALRSYELRKDRQVGIYVTRLQAAQQFRDAAKWQREHHGHEIVDHFGIKIERSYRDKPSPK